jgi:protocatechuate 3,4-dioxygenase beta subunit
VRLVVATAAALAGRVTDERGRPIAGARVVARSAAAPARYGVADAEGRIQWTDVDGGTWTLEAVDPATGRAEAAGVVPGGAEAQLVLRPEAVVGGRVLAHDGTPVRGAVVTLVHEDGREAARLRTDSEGGFSTRALPAGTYAVRVLERDGAALDPPVAAGSVRSGSAETVLRL